MSNDLNPKELFGDLPPSRAVRCRRVDRDFDPEVHERCPYCHGGVEDVETGKHENFCNFDPKKDAINFGFPGGSERLTNG